MDNKENDQKNIEEMEEILNEEIEDNIVLEENGEDLQISNGDNVKKLREKLKKCVEEKQEYLDGWQRAKADFINIRKRDEEEKVNFLKFAKEDVILQFLPVIDSFDMAFSNKEAWEKAPKEWRTGIEYIYSQMLSVIANNGVKQVNPIDEIFDPNKHISLETVAIDQKEKDGIIVSVVQKGYELNGKIIKEAKVKVGEYKVT